MKKPLEILLNKVFKKDKYSNLMEKLDEVLSQYRDINDIINNTNPLKLYIISLL